MNFDTTRVRFALAFLREPQRVLTVCLTVMLGALALILADGFIERTFFVFREDIIRAHFAHLQVLPENERSKTQVDRFRTRIDRAIDALEADAGRLAAGPLRIDQIGAACALGHVDFRHTREWRGRCPRLAAWFEAFSQRPSLLATVPK